MAAIKHLRLTHLVSNLNMSGMLARTMTSLSMSQAWTTKKVVPDVISDIPHNKLGVQYPEITVNEGNVVKPKQTKNPPAVSWGVQDQSSLFALCMTDPDAPSRSKPTQREWHHWLVVNIPGNSIEKGKKIMIKVQINYEFFNICDQCHLLNNNMPLLLHCISLISGLIVVSGKTNRTFIIQDVSKRSGYVQCAMCYHMFVVPKYLI